MSIHLFSSDLLKLFSRQFLSHFSSQHHVKLSLKLILDRTDRQSLKYFVLFNLSYLEPAAIDLPGPPAPPPASLYDSYGVPLTQDTTNR